MAVSPVSVASSSTRDRTDESAQDAASILHYIHGERRGRQDRSGPVYNATTGRIAGRVAFASGSDVNDAVSSGERAFAEWSSWSPLKRARVMFRFRELLESNATELAGIIASEHGKVLSDARGELQRGIEVVEFACGIPHLLKGEFTEGAGPSIDLYSVRQPLGVVAGITPFNFPAMIPMWKFAPAIACGNAFILKPSERDPGVPMRLAELMIEAGLPAGVLNVVNGDKEAVDAILDEPDIAAIGFVGSSAIAEYIYARGAANGKRVQCFG